MKRLPINRIAVGLAALAVMAPAAKAATETVLYSFPDSGTGYPLGTPHFRNGTLYGAGSGDEKSADGQAFKLTNKNGSWKETTLLTFDGSNGSTPFSGPTPGPDGVLYGTTYAGDAYNAGNVYAVSKQAGKWVGSTIWAFGGTEGDGMSPTSDLVIDKSGNLYGTTYLGGAYGVGTVFELTKVNGVWTESILLSFSGKASGWEPYAGLLMTGPETIYGTTQYGGDPGGDGTVFKLFKSEGVWKETVLYAFTGGVDGGEPWGSVVMDKNGALYGTTVFGGAADTGVAFMLSPSGNRWKETVLHVFDWQTGDGFYPDGGLQLGPSGSLYGTTSSGGGPGNGTVFKLAPSDGAWTETILHRFGNRKNDGGYLQGGVTVDKDGALYGMTFGGGKYNYGTVWKITP